MMLPTIGDVVNGRYEIVGVLARGGMGIVYRGRQLPMNRDIAIKMVLPEIQNSEKHLERFRREVQIAMRLKHPSIVEIYDFGHTEDGLLFIVMEYLEGRDLKSLLIHEGALSVGRTRTILENVLDALCVAHQERVIHRDLKPSNIMMTRVGRGREFPKILDFGIAKSEGDHTELTMSGEVLGSIPYLAPEGLRGEQVGFSSDVYSMGLISVEMLTGARVRQGPNTAQIVTQHLTVDVQIPRQLLGTPLESFLRTACSRDAQQRYPDAMAMYDALEHAFKGVDPELVCLADTVPSMSLNPDVAPTTLTPSGSLDLDARPTIPAPMVNGPGLVSGQPTAPTFAPHLNAMLQQQTPTDSRTSSLVDAPVLTRKPKNTNILFLLVAIVLPLALLILVVGVVVIATHEVEPDAEEPTDVYEWTKSVPTEPLPTEPLPTEPLPTEPPPTESLNPDEKPANEEREEIGNFDAFHQGMDAVTTKIEANSASHNPKVKHTPSTSKTKKDEKDPYTIEKY